MWHGMDEGHLGRGGGTHLPPPGSGAADWFLTAEERGNSATQLDRRRGDGKAWTEGNLVQALVHGAAYYPRLLAALRALRAGALVGIADWRGDSDELLDGEGTELGKVLAELA